MKTKTNILEKDVVRTFLDKQARSDNYFVEEVPIFIQSVDVVKVSKMMKSITAIEFKTDKWEQAIKQVLAESLVFDYLEIAIIRPKRKSTRQRIELKCKEKGIGLYYVDVMENKVCHIIKPKKNRQLWAIQRKKIKSYLQERLTDGRYNKTFKI